MLTQQPNFLNHYPSAEALGRGNGKVGGQRQKDGCIKLPEGPSDKIIPNIILFKLIAIVTLAFDQLRAKVVMRIFIIFLINLLK
jgi:hypothetical protein